MAVEKVAAVVLLSVAAALLLSYLAVQALRRPQERAPGPAEAAGAQGGPGGRAEPGAGSGAPRPARSRDPGAAEHPRIAQETGSRHGAAESPQPPRVGGDRAERIRARLLRSTVLIVGRLDRGLALGTGTLIDKQNRLVLTNYHVASRAQSLTVHFPIYRQGTLVTELRDYVQQQAGRARGLGAKFAFGLPSKDLALVRLDQVPDEALALPLAERRPRVGDLVYSVGNPGNGQVIYLWTLARGKVRELGRHKVRVTGERRDGLTLEADLVVTDSPTWRGDSGGPLVNDRGELIAVTQGTFTDKQTGSLFIDVREAKAALRQYAAEEGVQLDLPAGVAME
jgi:S1-C subfamily serine protease